MASQVFKGQTLLPLVLDMGTDVSQATLMRIYYEKPSGATGFWPAVLDGTNKLSYTFAENDVDEHGQWIVQGYVETPEGKGWGGQAAIEFSEHL